RLCARLTKVRIDALPCSRRLVRVNIVLVCSSTSRGSRWSCTSAFTSVPGADVVSRSGATLPVRTHPSYRMRVYPVSARACMKEAFGEDPRSKITYFTYAYPKLLLSYTVHS